MLDLSSMLDFILMPFFFFFKNVLLEENVDKKQIGFPTQEDFAPLYFLYTMLKSEQVLL